MITTINRSGSSDPVHPAYFERDTWGESMGGALGRLEKGIPLEGVKPATLPRIKKSSEIPAAVAVESTVLIDPEEQLQLFSLDSIQEHAMDPRTRELGRVGAAQGVEIARNAKPPRPYAE